MHRHAWNCIWVYHFIQSDHVGALLPKLAEGPYKGYVLVGALYPYELIKRVEKENLVLGEEMDMAQVMELCFPKGGPWKLRRWEVMES